MRFDNEALFVSLVSNYGMNLYLGAGSKDKKGQQRCTGEIVKRNLSSEKF